MLLEEIFDGKKKGKEKKTPSLIHIQKWADAAKVISVVCTCQGMVNSKSP